MHVHLYYIIHICFMRQSCSGIVGLNYTQRRMGENGRELWRLGLLMAQFWLIDIPNKAPPPPASSWPPPPPHTHIHVRTHTAARVYHGSIHINTSFTLCDTEVSWQYCLVTQNPPGWPISLVSSIIPPPPHSVVTWAQFLENEQNNTWPYN